MLNKPDQDLFDSSRMSFGAHLDELRAALIKGVLALAVGVGFGFWLGKDVVVYIQSPLQEGMQRFREKQSMRELREAFAAARSALPPELREEAKRRDEALLTEAKERIRQGYVPEVRQVDPRHLAASLRDLGASVELPAPPELEGEGEAEEESGTLFGKLRLWLAGPADGEEARLASPPPALLPMTTYIPVENDPRTRTIGTGMPDAFLVFVKAALLVGAVASSPFVFWFLWQFVASGLYQHERRYVWVFLPFSITLFLAGAAVAFFFVFQFVLDFMFGFYDWLEIDPTPRIGEWLNLALLLPLGFGIGFQLPLVMLFIERIGVVTVETYLKYWRVAVLVIFILSMVLTPADPQSMLLLAVPMTVLYFGGVALCRLMPKRKTPFDDALVTT